jgi:hypothetical protein
MKKDGGGDGKLYGGGGDGGGEQERNDAKNNGSGICCNTALFRLFFVEFLSIRSVASVLRGFMLHHVLTPLTTHHHHHHHSLQLVQMRNERHIAHPKD